MIEQKYCVEAPMSLFSTLKAEFDEEDYEAIKEIILKYKNALVYIGVDFDYERIIDVIISFALSGGLEDSFQAVIEYWYRKDKNIEYPDACLIAALNEFWKPNRWKDEYLENPEFKSKTQIWFEELLIHLGRDFMNQNVADYGSDEYGREYILLSDGTWVNFQFIKRFDWIKFQQFVNSTPQQKEEFFRFVVA